MAGNLKGRAARPTASRKQSSGGRNAASGSERTYTEWREGLSEREQRVHEVLELMSRGQWLSGVSDGVLAKKWACDPSTVRHVAAEASRAIRLRLRDDPEAQKEARARLLQNIDVIRAKAMSNGDSSSLRVALDALRAYGFYLGIEPARKLDVTERHDPFEGWTTEEKAAFARDGSRPRRALRTLAATSDAGGDAEGGDDGERGVLQ